ncbi:class I SAM-dependent RNA methyltransferase [Corynebacterium sp. ZY180755]
MDQGTHENHSDTLSKGHTCDVVVERMAHGGEGIAVINKRVVFIKGAFPGDHVRARITQLKKSFARAELVEVIEPSPLRGASRCRAAAAGGGCCDFHELTLDAELELKRKVLIDQLQRVGKLEKLPEISTIDLQPHSHWRTRLRLGVDEHGKAGVRKASSTDIVTDEQCAQAAPELYNGVVGVDAPRFTPGAEVVSVLDDDGEHHVVEIKKAPRGRRGERVTKVHRGSGVVRQAVDGEHFELPATAFWQAHIHAASAYSQQIQAWVKELGPESNAPVGWDLYGGVGAFVPALLKALGPQSKVHSVEASKHAAECGSRALINVADQVVFHTDTVEKALAYLPSADVVVLDPPRVGAGQDVVSAIAKKAPPAVIHIGCDPATFARDAHAWVSNGYALEKLTVFNAFPGTHHMETIGLFIYARG